MKYKLIGLSALALTLIAIFLISKSMPEDNGTRYIEHIKKEAKIPCEAHTEDILCTHLPIVKIDTAGKTIPGRPIKNELRKIIGYTVAEDGQSRILAKMAIIDNDDKYNHTDDLEKLSVNIAIKLRGNSSRNFDKPNYSLKIVNSDNTNNPQRILGMDSHHEWTLHGPYLDKTLIRNYMWYNIAGEIMEFSPEVRFCEVILNGEYQGLYLATETITAGKNGARLGLSIDKKNNSFSGYIIKLDKGNENDTSNIQPFTKYTLRTHMRHRIEYPGDSNITPELQENIKDDFSLFEKTLYSYDFDDPKYGYENFIDVTSFVDYFLINEITCNYDAGWMSTYMYKDIDSKYKMCVWDFNSACDGYQESFMPANDFQMQNCLWYVMLVKDDDFIERIIERYWELRKTVFSDEYLNDFIDGTVKYLGDAIERNYEVWGYSFGTDYDMLHPAERNPRSHNEAIDDMRSFLSQRLLWLDNNIETLRQHSAESRIKKFNENAN